MKKRIIILFLMHRMLLAMERESSSDLDLYLEDRAYERRNHDTLNYKKNLIKYFGFSSEEASKRILIKPRVHSTSNMKLNLAVQARNVDIITQILRSAPIWHPETIKEALILMDNPYIMCATTKIDIANDDKIRDLLVSKLPRDEQQDFKKLR